MRNPEVHAKALQLLARREHTRIELAEKLRRKGFKEDSVTETLDALVNENLVSHRRFIEDYLTSRVHKGYGPNRIRLELLQKGLAKEEVDRGFANAGIDWIDRARHCYRRKYRDTEAEDVAQRMKRRQYLYRRGYPEDVIRCVMADTTD